MFKFVLSTAQSLKSVIPAVINGRSISLRPLLHMASEAKVRAMPTIQLMRDFGSTPTLMRSLRAPVNSIRNTHTTALKLNESTLNPISEEFIDRYLPYLSWCIQMGLENDDERISFERYIGSKYGTTRPTIAQLKKGLLSDLQDADDRDYAIRVSEMQTQCIEIDREFNLLKPVIANIGDFLQTYFEDPDQQTRATKDSSQVKSLFATQLNIAIHDAKTEWELADAVSSPILTNGARLLKELRSITHSYWISFIREKIIRNPAFFNDPTLAKEQFCILWPKARTLSPSFNFPNDLIDRYTTCLEKDICIEPDFHHWMTQYFKDSDTPATQQIKEAVKVRLHSTQWSGKFKEKIDQMEKVIADMHESTNSPRAN